MFNFCKHEWEKVSETTLPSALEQGITTGIVPNMYPAHGEEATNQLRIFYQKQYVLVLKCKKCGKLDKTFTTNP